MLSIRAATPADTPEILALIRELPEYEKLAHAAVATETDRHPTPFASPLQSVEVLMAEWQGKVVGFALFFHSYSTFLGKPGIYLEDLFVRPPYRGRGIGKALLIALAKLTEERGCGRLEWSVLDWNEPAIGFYRKL